jgi:hypothetical protein
MPDPNPDLDPKLVTKPDPMKKKLIRTLLIRISVFRRGIASVLGFLVSSSPVND